MNKISKGLALSSVLAVVLLLGSNVVFAQCTIEATDEEETLTIQIVAIVAAIAGAGVAVAQGIANKPKEESISAKKILSAVITSIMAALVLINLGAVVEQTDGMTILAIFIAYFLVGYGTDKGLAKLDK